MIVFLLPAEWVDVKYCMPINEKEYSPEEIAAAVKIQSMWKGTYVRLLMKARTPGMILHMYGFTFIGVGVSLCALGYFRVSLLTELIQSNKY